MTHIIMKSEAQKRQERQVARDFGANESAEHRELAECIAAKTEEAWRRLKKEGSRYEG